MPKRRAELSLGACLLVAYVYFYQAGGWNQNSRFALVRAIVELGTFRIDDTARFNGRLVTGDLAEHDGHLYSDKAPGLALTAVVPVAIARPLVAEPGSRAGIATLSYIATVVTAGLPTVLAALIVFRLAGVLGAPVGAAAFAAAVFGLGTPAWSYATIFFGHALTAACLVAAFAAAVALGRRSSTRRESLLAFAVGAFAGWATITEYPAAIPAAIIALLALSHNTSLGAASRARILGGVAGGALACAAVLALFNQISFGSPLNLGYASEREFPGMLQGFFGVTYPRPSVFRELLLGRYRGLLRLAPIVAVAPVGFLLLIRLSASRRAGIAAAAIALYYLLFNASYYYWDGGWSYGPRHMAPALPFVALALAPVWSAAKPIVRVGLGALAAYGAALTFVAVSTTALPTSASRDPVAELIWPSFANGHLSINHQAFVESDPSDRRDPIAHAWNLGERAGLGGWASLTPLFAMWGGIALAAFSHLSLFSRPRPGTE